MDIVQSSQIAPPNKPAYDAEATKVTLARGLRTILLPALASTLLALAYLTFAPASFKATASLLLEPKSQSVSTDGRLAPDPLPGPALIENQMAVLRSDLILSRAAGRLNAGNVTADAQAGATAANAASSLIDFVRVTRVPESYVINVEATASEPERAAHIANTVAETYLADVVAAKTAQTQVASAALDKRLAELKEHVQKAQQLIDAYHRANASLTAGDKRLPEQRLEKLSGQLIDARVSTAEKKGLLDQISRTLRPGFNFADLPDALRSGALAKLLDAYARLARRAASLSANLQDRHPELIEVRSRLAEVDAEIRADLKRKEKAAELAYQSASDREKELGAQRDAAAREWEVSNASVEKLAALDQELGAHRARLEHDLAEPQLPSDPAEARLPGARLLTSAAVPKRRSGPAPALVIAAGLIGGLGLGLALALMSHWLDKTVRSRRAVSQATGLANVLAIPPLSGSASGWPAEGGQFSPILAALGQRNSNEGGYRQSVLHLLGQVRRQQRPGRPNTIVFAAPGLHAGNSSTALAVASAAAQSGDRVLVVDAASTGPDVSHAFGAKLKTSALEAPDTKEQLNEIIVREPQSGMRILPLALTDLRTLAVQQQRRLVALLNSISQNYDLVVIDAGAMLTDEGSAFLLAAADQVLVVASAGVTTASELSHLMEVLDPFRDRLTAAVLTNAPRPA